MSDAEVAGVARPWWESSAFLLALMLLAIAPLVDLPGHMGRYRIELGGSPLLDR